MPPDFSVITVTLNSGSTLKRTMTSVLAQTGLELEYVVQDGLSTDDTLAIVESFSDKRVHVRSERDAGIYDAMNRGLSRTTGRYIAILNSDDFFASPTVLSEVLAAFQGRDDIVLYGDIEYVDKRGRLARRWQTGPYEDGIWKRGWQPPHPAVFIPKRLHELHGGYDPTYRIAGDYKLLLTFGLVAKVAFCYIPKILVRMSKGGISTSGAPAVLRGNRECLRAWGELGLATPRAFVAQKLFYKAAAHVSARVRKRPSQ